jgi:hypothetical protein
MPSQLDICSDVGEYLRDEVRGYTNLDFYP